VARKATAVFDAKRRVYALLAAATGVGDPLEGVQVAYNFPADARDDLEPECVYFAGLRSRNQKPLAIGPAKPVEERPAAILGIRVQKDDQDPAVAEDRLEAIADAIASLLHDNKPDSPLKWWGFGDVDSTSYPNETGWVAEISIEVVALAHLR
jgi:hypothetical protein